MSDSKAVAVAAPPSSAPVSVFYSEQSFASAQRMAKALTSSMLVPEAYRGDDKMGNALIAMDMANRMNLSPMTVMQNLHVISGRPSWASQFIISALAQCGLFGPLRWRITDLGEREVTFTEWEGPKGNRNRVTKKTKLHDKEFVAYAVEKSTGEVLEGPPVSYGMAVQEGWFYRQDSKWLSMPELMGRYRSAAFFGRLYAPHILNGMQTADEVVDVEYEVVAAKPAPEPAAAETEAKPVGRASGVHAAMKAGKAEPKVDPKPAKPKPADKPVQAREERQADVVDAEAEEVTGEVEERGDMFGAPDDDDYQPA